MASLLCTFSNDWIITVNHMRAYLGICDLVVEVFHQKWSKFLKDFLWKAEPSWWRNTEVQSSMLSARDERAPLPTALSGFCLQRPLNWQWQWTPSFWPRTGNRSLSCKDQCFLNNFPKACKQIQNLHPGNTILLIHVGKVIQECGHHLPLGDIDDSFC